MDSFSNKIFFGSAPFPREPYSKRYQQKMKGPQRWHLVTTGPFRRLNESIEKAPACDHAFHWAKETAVPAESNNGVPYESPLVSLNKALLNLYFWGGYMAQGDWLIKSSKKKTWDVFAPICSMGCASTSLALQTQLLNQCFGCCA